MTETRNGPVTLDLNREEAWVLHAAALGAVTREVEEDRTPSRELDVLERVEAAATVDESDLDVAERLLESHLEDAPERDRDPGRAVLDRIRTARA